MSKRYQLVALFVLNVSIDSTHGGTLGDMILLRCRSSFVKKIERANQIAIIMCLLFITFEVYFRDERVATSFNKQKA